MTLAAYSPEQLDQLALRLLDVAAVFREMALTGREHGVGQLDLHDRKAQEWCDRLEHWARKAQADLDVRIRTARAARRAQVFKE
jgi:hypothetical protein